MLKLSSKGSKHVERGHTHNLLKSCRGWFLLIFSFVVVVAVNVCMQSTTLGVDLNTACLSNVFHMIYSIYCVKSRTHAQSLLTLWHPMDYNSPGSSVHGIFQTRILERVAISFSKGSFWPKNQTHISCISCIRR